MKRSRNWILTNNYKEEEPLSNEELLEYIQNITGLVYIAFQLEQGEQGTKHHQIYISFKNAKSFETIKKLFPKAHIEAMKGTPTQASEYCTKEDTRLAPPVIDGDLPIKGKRTDLEDIHQMIKEGCSNKEIEKLTQDNILDIRIIFKESDKKYLKKNLTRFLDNLMLST